MKRRRFLTIPDTSEARLGIFLLAVLVVWFAACSIAREVSEPSPKPLPPPIIWASSDKEITHGDTTKKQIIFTFDGGDGIQSADTILAVLAKHHVKGTFFLTGKFVEANPELVKRMAAAGHEIFSHTYDHPHLTALADGQITAELTRMDGALEETVGSTSRPYFRAPYGDRDERVLEAAYRAGYQSVYWSIDGHDWEQPSGETAGEVRDQILSNLAPGNIYLMHLGDSITGEILDDVFTKIEGRGYSLVSLTQGL